MGELLVDATMGTFLPDSLHYICNYSNYCFY